MRVDKLYILMICFILLLTGCNIESKHKLNPETSEKKNEFGDNGSKGTANNENYIKSTLSSGVVVDAQIKIPTNVDYNSMPIFKTNYQLFNSETTFLNVFMNDKEIKDVYEQNYTEDGGGTLKRIETVDGSFLYLNKNSISYTGNLFREVETIISYKNEYLEEVKEDFEFEFASRKEVFEIIKTKLESLNIEINDQYTCYSLSYEWLEKQYDEFINDEFISKYVDKVDVEWTEESNCYYFVFNQTINTFSITNKQRDYNNIFITAPNITVIYAKNGIESIKITHPYKIESLESNHSILNAEEALVKLDAIFNSIILEGDYQVNEMELEYVPIPDKDFFLLIPAWRITVEHTYWVCKINCVIHHRLFDTSSLYKEKDCR